MTDKRPNILWFCSDQQRFDTVGALGNPYVQTPTLDRLVSEGVAFRNAYCQSPVCTPSRASFMTGMYPSRVHNTRNGNETFPDHPPVITKLIAESGYECGLVGKFHLQSSGYRTESRIDDGYSYWKFSHAPRDDWPEGHDYADWVRAKGGDLDRLRLSEEHVPAEMHQTTWAAERAIEFIRHPRQCPWLLSINTYDPHPPFIPPKAYSDRFDPEEMPGPHFKESDLANQARLSAIDFQGDVRRPGERDIKTIQAKYYAMIAQIDERLGDILDVLEETGQRENTVVIYTSDHGEMMGDHGLLEKGCRFYEGLVRVPLIFSWPGHFENNLQADGLVELIDMTSTILDLTGLESPHYDQGRSLLPILIGEAPPGHHRDFVRCEYFDALDATLARAPSGPLGTVFQQGEEEAGADRFKSSPGSFATMYRDRRYKLSIYHGHNLGELYDLEKDPWEFENLWDSPAHQDIKNELIFASYDSHVLLTTDVGSPRIAPM